MKRLMITLGVLAICLAARQIPLPFVQLPAEPGDRMPSFSIMALGVAPLLTGYLLVEFAALLVPAWRPLRVGPPAGRASLHRAALIIAILLAFFQGVVFILSMEARGTITPGPGPRMVAVLTLMGAIVAQIALARWVNRDGLGNGFAILLLGGLIPAVVSPLWHAFLAGEYRTIPGWVLPAGLLTVAVLAGAAWWMFSSFRLPVPPGTPHPSLISRPACGISPLTVGIAVVGVITAFIAFVQRGGATHAPADPTILPWGFHLLLSVGAAIFFAYLFNRPKRIAEVWQCLSPNPPEGIPRLNVVLAESAGFIAVVTMVYLWASRLGAYAPDGGSVLLVTAVVCDLAREWRARQADSSLVPIWEIHQTYAVAPALRCLESEGIRAVAKGLHLRALLQFFGPYVPIRLLVPTAQAAQAYALLQERWPRGEMRQGEMRSIDAPARTQ